MRAVIDRFEVGEKGAWLVDEDATRENLAANERLMDELFRD